MNDMTNRTSSHPKFVPEGLERNASRAVAVSDFLYHVRCKRPMVSFALSPTTFVNRVLRVVFLCAQKQMVRVYAGWIVAAVQHAQAFGDRRVVNLPRNLMRPAPPEHSVTLNCGGGPFPAVAVWPKPPALIDFRPKAFRKRNGLTFEGLALCGAKFPTAMLDRARRTEERIPAQPALKPNACTKVAFGTKIAIRHDLNLHGRLGCVRPAQELHALVWAALYFTTVTVSEIHRRLNDGDCNAGI